MINQLKPVLQIALVVVLISMVRTEALAADKVENANLSVLGGASAGAQTLVASGKTKEPDVNAGMAYGAALGIPLLNGWLEPELGVLLFGRAVTGGGIEMKQSQMLISALAKFRVMFIRLGAGPHYNIGRGNVSFSDGNSTVTKSFKDANQKKSELGLTVMGGLVFDIGERFLARGEVRQSIGLSNVSESSKFELSWVDTMALVGAGIKF